jgi:processive 1,2-diacylglycerol beta-glucosyltransferase
MMRAANVFVGRAGMLTVAEALAVGVAPILCSPVPGQEVRSADFLVNSGVALLARDEEDVVEKVRFLSSHAERLAQLSANAKELGKPSATQKICERVAAAF